MSMVAENIGRILKEIEGAAVRSGRSSGDVRLIAVSKTFGVEQIEEAIKAGQRIFGENRVQEAREKIPLIKQDAEWHLIGRLQKNKAKYIPGMFDMVHSVDSYGLAEALNSAMIKAVDSGKLLKSGSLDVLVQVNVSGEAQKGGILCSEAATFIKDISSLPYIRVKGLMTIPKHTEEPENSRACYRQLREIRDLILLENIPGTDVTELSMGMSSDYVIAVEEGATLVRVGSAIFGEREYPVGA